LDAGISNRRQLGSDSLYEFRAQLLSKSLITPLSRTPDSARFTSYSGILFGLRSTRVLLLAFRNVKSPDAQAIVRLRSSLFNPGDRPRGKCNSNLFPAQSVSSRLGEARSGAPADCPGRDCVMIESKHANYYGLRGNSVRLDSYRNQAARIWRKWISRTQAPFAVELGRHAGPAQTAPAAEGPRSARSDGSSL